MEKHSPEKAPFWIRCGFYRGSQEVSAVQLAQAILVSALLANEQAGAIRLEVRQKKVLLGMTRANSLYVEPDRKYIPWTEGRLEASIYPLASNLLANKGRNEVSNLLVALLREDTPNPWLSVVERVKAGMAQRGLLKRVEEKKLKVFSRVHYQLPDDTKALLLKQPYAPLQQLLQHCQQERPQVWALLQAHIRSAISQRTERTDTSVD